MAYATKDFYNLANIKKIMDSIEKMGKLKKGYYSEEVESMSKKLRHLREEMKKKPKKQRDELLDEIRELKSELEEEKQDILTNKTYEIGKGNADLDITTKTIKKHNAFVANDINTVIICQIIKQELRKSYKLMPANMNTIIEQVKSLLDNPMPKVVVRADICKFFESIPQDKIVKKLADDGYVSQRTMKYLRRILYRCNELQGNEQRIGIPRGLSFSSYLSELYLLSVDTEITNMKGVYFYKRYVDDIIMICNPSVATVDDYWQLLDKILTEKDLKLHHDSEKKYLAVYDKESKDSGFDYLGYHLSYSEGHLNVSMSPKRFNKYKKLIDAVFDLYSKSANYRKGKEEKLEAEGQQRKRPLRKDALHCLFTRLRVLTSNGFLSGKKNYVSTGIYYSNKHLTDLSQLKELDRYLSSKIEEKECFCPPANLFNYASDNGYAENIKHIKHGLHNFSFKTGFQKRLVYRKGYYSRTLMDLQHIYYKLQANE